jgi:hypothetical protein
MADCLPINPINLIIIDINDHNYEILTKNLKDNDYTKKRFKDIETALDDIKQIKFIETFIIINENLKLQLIEKLKENLKKIYTIPKIFILNDNEKENNIIEKDFYCYGKMNLYQLNKYLSELFINRKKIFNETIKNRKKEEKKMQTNHSVLNMRKQNV